MEKEELKNALILTQASFFNRYIKSMINVLFRTISFYFIQGGGDIWLFITQVPKVL